jgi:hypothetical protein
MIKKISVTDNDKEKYLYENEKNVLLSMLNNNELKREVKNKCFKIVKIGTNTATVKIYKVTDKFFFLKDYILLTTLNIKYN